MKADDAKTYAEVRAVLTSHRINLSKLHVRVSSGKVHLSGELHKMDGPSMRLPKLLEVAQNAIRAVRGVRFIIVEPDLERFVRDRAR